MKIKKSTIIVLAMALLFCLVSMIGTAVTQSNYGRTEVTTHYVTLTELADQIRANNAATGKDVAVTFTENTNSHFGYMLLKPSNATAE